MIYYVTDKNVIYPPIFTTQKAAKVDEWIIKEWLETLLKREYQMYDLGDAQWNLNSWLQEESQYKGWAMLSAIVPRGEWNPRDYWMPTDKEIQDWVYDLMYNCEAGQKLLSLIGTQLHEMTKKEIEADKDKDIPMDELTMSNLLENLAETEETNNKQESQEQEDRRLLRKTLHWLTIDYFDDEDEQKTENITL